MDGYEEGYFGEGVEYYTFPRQVNNTKPLYRFYNKVNHDNILTSSEDEKDRYIDDSTYEFKGITGYNFRTERELLVYIDQVKRGIITPPGPEEDNIVDPSDERE